MPSPAPSPLPSPKLTASRSHERIGHVTVTKTLVVSEDKNLVNQYQVIKQIGEGSTGTVVCAKNLDDDRLYVRGAGVQVASTLLMRLAPV